jgi:hypothetical protein
MIGRGKIKKSIATHRLLTLRNIKASTNGLDRSVQRRPEVRKYHSWFEKSSFRRYPLEFTAVVAHTITIVCYHSLVHTTFQLTRASPHEVDRDRSSEALSEMALPGRQSTNVGQNRSRVQPTGTKCVLIRLRESIAEDPLYYSPRTLSAR